MPARGVPRGLLAALLVLVPAARGADDRPPAVVAGESKATATRIAEADRHFADKKWAEGLTELQAVLDTAGDDLVPVDAGHSVRARRLVHLRIAALPPDELKRYRDRVDVQARRWLQQGAANRDAAVLRKLVDEAFCSSPAEQALELLGDLAFERGQFLEAESWWQLLAPPLTAAERAGRYLYPAPGGDVARVHAKQLMALYFQGHSVDGKKLLDAFKAKHATAEGVLGGRKGKYVDFLAELFARPSGFGDDEPAWSTFGGDATRSRVQPAPDRVLDRLSILCRGGPSLRLGLPTLVPQEATVPPHDRFERFTQRSDFSRSLAFHPLIVDHRLLVADPTRVLAFDLRQPGGAGVELYRLGFAAGPPPPDWRGTLTAVDGCVYARLESLRTGDRAAFDAPGEPKASDNRLVSLRLDPLPGDSPVRWVEKGMAGNNVKKRGKVVFEGTPVVRDGLVYAAATHFEAGKSLTAVHCYAADPAAKAAGDDAPEPVLRWHTDVCEAREQFRTRYRHYLLTLAGPLVVCCGDSGVIVALEAATGRPVWAVRYKGRAHELDARPPLTDLAPCVYADGRVYAAPGDGNGILCLDPDTGRTLWRREGIDVVHLLGVGAGRLIFATPSGLRALDGADGTDVGGWSHDARVDYGKDGARGGWTPAGRGFLAGDYVFWPAVESDGDAYVHAFRQDSGEPDENPTLLHRVPVGNLVYVDGCLAVAGRDELSVFVPPAWRLPERERGVRAAPKSAESALALARAEADAGLSGRADAGYLRAERLAGRNRPLARLARAERHRQWLEAGRRAVIAGRPEDAREAFDNAIGVGELKPGERATALLEAAKAWQQAGRFEDAASAWQAVLDADDLRDARLASLNTAGHEAARQLALLEPALAAEREKSAASQLAAATTTGDVERVARRFPFTTAGREALERLARENEKAGRAGAAADYWRRLLVLADDAGPAPFLAGMARACERQGCTEAARSFWQVLADVHGDRSLPELDRDRPIRAAVADRLRNLPARSAAAGLPLHQNCDLALDPTEELLPLPGEDVFLTVRTAVAPQLICRDGSTGQERWRAAPGFRPQRAGARDDLILLGGDAGVAAVRREDGGISWSMLLPNDGQAAPLTDFLFAAGKVFCMQGERLLAFCASSGEPWHVNTAGVDRPAASPTPGTRFGLAGPLVWLQSAEGRRRAFFPDGTLAARLPPSERWTSAPVACGNDLLTVERSRRVVCLGTKERWAYTIPGFTTLTGRPARVAVIGDAVLLLFESNIGYQLQRLDRDSGQPVWPRPVLLTEPVSDPADWAAGDGAVCLVENDALTARSLTTGQQLWRTPLDAAGRPWHVERLPNGLLAFPRHPAGRHFAFRWLTERLQWTVVPEASEAVGRGFPVCCFDLTGKLTQRFDLASRGTTLRRTAAPAAGLSVLPRAAVWRGAADECQPVQVSARGIVVVVGPRAWCLTAADAK